MTEHEALLRAILTHPAEDTPRMVYADWLSENGREDYAAYIRDRVDHPEWLGTCDGDESVGQPCPIPSESLDESELIFCHACQFWIEQGFPARLLGEGRYKAHRGFVDSLTLTAADWLKYHESLYWHLSQSVRCTNSAHANWKAQCPVPGCVNARLPRPFPLTAQPISRVTFSDPDPLYTVIEPASLGTITKYDEAKRTFECEEWPGVEFTMPPEPVDTSYAAFRRAIEGNIIRAFGIPEHLAR